MEILTDEVKVQLTKLIEDDLEFVELPKELLCSYCGEIPLFHYLYPCLHPYCRVCYVNVCQRLQKKCRVCKTGIGHEMLQSKEVEFTIYKLKVICPNKLYGCKEEIALYEILNHLEECTFLKGNHLPKLYNKDKDKKDEDSADLKNVKALIEEIKTAIKELVKSNQNSDKNISRLTKENKNLSKDVRKLTGDVRMFMGANEALDIKMATLMEKLEHCENESRNENSEIKKNVQSLQHKLHLVSNTVTTIELNIDKKMALNVEELKKLIDDSQQLLINLKETNVELIAKNEQLATDVQKTISENNKLAKLNQDMAFNNSNTLDLIKQLLEENKKSSQDYKNLKDDCQTLIDTNSKNVDEDFKKLKEMQDIAVIKKMCLDEKLEKEAEIKEEILKMHGSKNGTLLVQIENYGKRRKERAYVLSDPFYSAEREHKMIVQIEFRGGSWLCGHVQCLPGQYKDSQPSGYHFRVVYSVLDQSQRSERRDVVQIFEPRFGMSEQQWMKDSNDGDIRITNLDELEKENKDAYFKNDTMYVKVIVEPLTSLFGNCFSRDGIQVLIIDNYQRTKRESLKWINRSVFSRYFYSGEREGFRMQARVGWLDSGRIYFALSFLVGENDSHLPAFFSHKCTVVAVNQRDGCGENDLLIGTKILDAAVIGQEKVKQHMMEYDCHQMRIACEKVEREPFLINDQIIVKCAVEKL